MSGLTSDVGKRPLRPNLARPLTLLVMKNGKIELGSPELLPEHRIPSDEIYSFKRTRYHILTTLNEVFTEEAIEMLVKTVDARDE